ncbi:EamA family transporter [Ectothiorhodospira mobilis]|uniref:EamA family transporter n=1 Tax=Ectothiorhodospira mobilis TaxID=195064 RepID=UPI001EE923F6|nr:EamA family transporter [Ectothiorhodospira mobilis]MCG5536792.1 EamA family transporter [Ectothiorhodospira mobilis]
MSALTVAYLAVALSIALHVGWNLMARHARRECDPLWWALAGHTALLGPWALHGLATQATWSMELAAMLAISSSANMVYFIALRAAYQYASVALVYPVARSSPLLVALWAWLLFGVETGPIAWVGLVIGSAGLLWLAWSGRAGDTRHALPWAGLAALMTSIYSISDKTAVSALPTFASVMGFMSVGYLSALAALSIMRRRSEGRWTPPCTPRPFILLGGSLAIGSAYALVIGAMRELPAAHVVALANLGIVIASLLSIFAFGERAAWRTRLVAAIVVTVGIIMVQWG